MIGCAAPGRRNSVLWGAGTQGVAVGRPGSLGLSEETDSESPAEEFSPLAGFSAVVWEAVDWWPLH